MWTWGRASLSIRRKREDPSPSSTFATNRVGGKSCERSWCSSLKSRRRELPLCTNRRQLPVSRGGRRSPQEDPVRFEPFDDRILSPLWWRCVADERERSSSASRRIRPGGKCRASCAACRHLCGSISSESIQQELMNLNATIRTLLWCRSPEWPLSIELHPDETW